MASTAASRKAKGRRLQQRVAKAFLHIFPSLTELDLYSLGMGQSGRDIFLSTAAEKLCRYDIECKNQESLNIWAALKQAEANTTKEGRVPLVVFSRNHAPDYAALPFSDRGS